MFLIIILKRKTFFFYAAVGRDFFSPSLTTMQFSNHLPDWHYLIEVSPWSQPVFRALIDLAEFLPPLLNQGLLPACPYPQCSVLPWLEQEESTLRLPVFCQLNAGHRDLGSRNWALSSNAKPLLLGHTGSCICSHLVDSLCLSPEEAATIPIVLSFTWTYLDVSITSPHRLHPKMSKVWAPASNLLSLISPFHLSFLLPTLKRSLNFLVLAGRCCSYIVAYLAR